MSLFKRPQIMVPPPPPSVVQEQVETPTPVPTPGMPEATQARRRQDRQNTARQGRASTVLTSAQGIPSATGLRSLTNIGPTILGM